MGLSVCVCVCVSVSVCVCLFVCVSEFVGARERLCICMCVCKIKTIPGKSSRTSLTINQSDNLSRDSLAETRCHLTTSHSRFLAAFEPILIMFAEQFNARC